MLKIGNLIDWVLKRGFQYDQDYEEWYDSITNEYYTSDEILKLYTINNMLVEVTHHHNSIEEFIKSWCTDKIVFREEDVYEDEKGKKWYRKYNKPTLQYLKEEMEKDLKYLINKAKNEKDINTSY